MQLGFGALTTVAVVQFPVREPHLSFLAVLGETMASMISSYPQHDGLASYVTRGRNKARITIKIIILIRQKGMR